MLVISTTTAGRMTPGMISAGVDTAGVPMVATIRGEVALDQLRIGDRVLTRDNGLQELRWLAVQQDAATAPIRISAGALGPGYPQSDLLVSPQHRVVVTGEIALMLFDAPEAEVAAQALLGLAGISRETALAGCYALTAFDHPETILVNGAWVAAGPLTLSGWTSEARAELAEARRVFTDPGLCDGQIRSARDALRRGRSVYAGQ